MESNELNCEHCKTDNAGIRYCKGHLSGMLSKDDIRVFGLFNKNEIQEESLQATSYDLRLGEGHCIYEKGAWVPVWISENKSVPTNGNIQFRAHTYLTIEPFGSALIQLKETINLRDCINAHKVMVCGRFDLKLSLVRKGLISQQATQVEPLYYGKLFCYLFNMSGNPIVLRENERIATIEFNFVTCKAYCNKEIREDIVSGIEDSDKRKYMDVDDKTKARMYCNEHGIDDVRFFLSSEESLPAHGGLSVFKAQFDALKHEHGEKLRLISADNIKSAAKDEYEKTFKNDFLELQKKFEEDIKETRSQIKESRNDIRNWLTLLAVFFVILGLFSGFFDKGIKYLELKYSETENAKKADAKIEAGPAVPNGYKVDKSKTIKSEGSKTANSK